MPTTRSSSHFSAKLDPYCLRHLCLHFHDADLADDLYGLVTGRRWLNCSTKFDPSGLQYRQDIDLAFKAAAGQEALYLKNDGDADAARNLVRPAALAWLSGNYGQSARLVSIYVLEAMVQLGEVEQAIRRAKGIPDSIARIEALVRVGRAAFEIGRQSKACTVWSQAQELLEAMPLDFFNEKLSAMAGLSEALLHAGQEENARAVAMALEAEVMDKTKQEGNIVSTTPMALVGTWGGLGEKERVLKAVGSLTDTESRIRALSAAAAKALLLNRETAFEFLELARKRVSEIDSPAAKFELALALAEAGRKFDALQVAGEKLEHEQYLRLSVALARGYLTRGETRSGICVLTEAIRQAAAQKPCKKHLRFIADLASLALLHKNIRLSGVRALISSIQDEFAAELNYDDLGIIAFGLAAFGDEQSAKKAVSKALNWKSPTDDWQENEALSTLAELLGQTGELEGLTWILTLVKNRREAWQQAELAYHLARAFRTTGNDAKAVEAERIMQTAAQGTNDSAWRLNAQGILAAWHTLDDKSASVNAGRELALQTAKAIQDRDNSPDDLIELAKTLACRNAPVAAKSILTRAIGAIQKETDVNTLARAIGAAAELAVTLAKTGTIPWLLQLARSIDDDWLQAEALFWIAGWEASVGGFRRAQKIFGEAATKGLDTPLSSNRIEKIWRQGDLEMVEEIAQDIGWPSTVAAAIFSGLMLAMETPEPIRIMRGLETLDHLTEGYNYIRSVCHRRLVQAADTLTGQGTTVIHYWIGALEHNKERDMGEVWAVIGACLPILAFRFGNTFIRSLWGELSRVQDLNP